MLTGQITPLFRDPRLPKDNDPKTPRGSCAHPPWSLRSSPESSASPRDQIPDWETEKPRNHLHRRSCNIPRTKHKECTEEYSERWRNACFACTCSSNQKEKDFPMLLGNLQKLQFHPRFCYPATSQTGLFFWQTPYLAVGNTVLQPTKFLSWFCRGKIFSSLKAARSTFQLGPMG